MAFIELRKVFKNYNGFAALKDINLDINLNETIAILGPSGSGKTTLLKIIGQQENCDGSIFINNQKVKKKDRSMLLANVFGYIYQNFQLVDYFTVKENIILPFSSSNLDEKNFTDLVSSLNLNDKLNQYPASLSGGEKQKVAIARTFLRSPKIILADEPTGSLDSKNAEAIMQILQNNRDGRTIIFATHNESLAYSYASRIIRIDKGEIISDEKIKEVSETPFAPINEARPKLQFKDALKRTILSYKKRHKGILGVSIIFLVCLFGLLSLFGVSEGSDAYLRILKNIRLDSRYLEISHYVDSKMTSADELLVLLDSKDIHYYKHNNFNFLANNFLYESLYQEDELDFNYTFSFIDFSLINSYQLDLLGLKSLPDNKDVLINSIFASKLDQLDDISLIYSSEILGETLNLDINFKIGGIIDEGNLYNESKIYFDIKYAYEIFPEDFCNFLFLEQDHITIPLCLIILSDFDEAYTYLTSKDNIYPYLLVEDSPDYYLLNTSTIILRVAFNSLLSAFKTILSLALILILLCSISLLSLSINFCLRKRQREIYLLASYGYTKESIFLIPLSEALITTFLGFGLALGLTYLTHLLIYQNSSLILNQNWKFDIYNFSLSGLVSSLFLIIIISLFVALHPLNKLNKTNLGEVLRNE